MAERMRPADREELVVIAKRSPLSGLRRSAAVGTAYAVQVGDRVEAICGHLPHPTAPCGIVWLLGTPDLTTDPRLFMRESLRVWNILLDAYGTLTNLIWRGNTEHIKWLAALGCEFHDNEQDPNSLIFQCVKPQPWRA